MTVAKIRNLSQVGVVTDVDPYNLPPNGFSMAVNARFRAGSVVRAPVFRRVPFTLVQSDPRFVFSDLTPAAGDNLYLAYLNGKVSKVAGLTETDYSIAAFATNTSESPYTSVSLQGVLYVNREDRVPWSLTTSDTQFHALAGGWDATWRAKLLRTCGGALVALGVTKGGTSVPTMVKTSSIAVFNTIPASWDITDPSTNATENTLGDMKGPIVDANLLGEDLIIYGTNEAWKMVADGSSKVFRYDKLFKNETGAGAISANCSVEIDGRHYVFGPTDIWVHDGVSKQSIVDLQTRNFIYSTINISQSKRCNVSYDAAQKEIRFSYVGGDGFVGFSQPTVPLGCNRCAVYNIVEKTWSFDDLPFTYSSCIANLGNAPTWTSITGTWDTIGSTWLDFEDGGKRGLVMVGDVSSTYSLLASLYGVDPQGPGTIVGYAVDTNATKGVTLIRDGIDLDELPEVEDNRGYKIIDSIYPQARFESGAQPLMFSFGSADNFNENVTFSDPQSYDGVEFTKCDFYSGGRYLYMKVTHNDYHYFALTGIDLRLEVTGQE